MRNFLLVTNSRKKEVVEYAETIKHQFEEHGLKCTGNILTEEREDLGYMYTNPDLVPPETEGIIALGGDGALIRAAKDLIALKLPMIGINFGTLGYLTEIEAGDLEKVIPKLKSDDYTIEKRILLRGEILREGKVLKTNIAFNDVVLNRTPPIGVLKYDIKINGHFLTNYSADGVIISTPTGSTGYNLAAGGPIVQPTADTILLTPLCAHTLNSRSIIFSADTIIEIEAKGFKYENQQKMQVQYDGDATGMMLEPGDVIKVRKSGLITKIMKLNDMSFVEQLGKKMR